MSDNLIMASGQVLATSQAQKSFSGGHLHYTASLDPSLSSPDGALRPVNGRGDAITLRPYQQSMVAATYGHIRNGQRRVLLVVIMGAGKTVTSAWMIRDAVSRGHRCLFLVSLNVLLEQTAKTLRGLGVSCTILQGGRVVDDSAPVIVGSAQTIHSRLRRGQSLDDLLGPLGLVVVDEAHNTAYLDAYSQIEAHYAPVGTRFIGLTATPCRLKQEEYLGQHFDALVTGPQPPEIVAMGGAVPCRGYTLTGALDLETLKTRAGDYIDSQIASQATRPEALDHVLKEYRRLAFDRCTLMVGATVDQAIQTCKKFLADGIPAEVVVGSTSQEERAAIFQRVKDGQTKVICSVGCLTAGFDLPKIDCVLYVRATKSKALFFQTAGRGSRPYPGKTDYLLIDFGGNLRRHGNPMGYQVYDIGPKPPKPPVEVLTKTCPECGAEVNNFAQACPECGYEFSGDALDDQEDLVLASLNEFVDKFTKAKIKALRGWRKAAYLAGQSPDVAMEKFSATYGHTPPAEWLRHATLGKRVSQKRKLAYLDYLEQHCKKNRWADQWIRFHLGLEFGTSDLDALDLFRQWGEVLEVPYSASWAEVKARYLEKIRDLPDGHPDHEALALAMQDAREDFAADSLEVAL